MQLSRGVLLDSSAATVLFIARGIEGVHQNALRIQESQIYIALSLRETTARRLKFSFPHRFDRVRNIHIITMTVPRGDDVIP